MAARKKAQGAPARVAPDNDDEEMEALGASSEAMRLDPAFDASLDDREGSLRPKVLADFQGQARLKENLSLFISAARGREEALDHLFLMGPPGLGKTTLAQVVANELGVEFKPTSAPALDKPKDLAGVLTTLRERSVLFIDEIHRLKPAIEEMLYIAMEDYELDWIIGQGPSARTVRVPVPPFTLIGATTKPGAVSAPLSSRFGISLRFGYYDKEELTAVIRRSAGILEVDIDDDAAVLLAASSRGTPRIANRLLRRMRDFAEVGFAGSSREGAGPAVAGTGRAALGREASGRVTSRVVIEGLERLDRDILKAVITKYSGGPVGAETLAITVGESVDGLEDYYEPFLIQAGLIARTPRGRVATRAAYEHLGLELPREDGRLLF